MFSKKSNTATASINPLSAPPSSDSCIIADGTTIEGTIKCSKGIRLDGKVVGDVFCDQRFVMGDKGKVAGCCLCCR